MTELQQARGDYIAALEREQRLTKENSDLHQKVYELTMKLTVLEFRAVTAEMLNATMRAML